MTAMKFRGLTAVIAALLLAGCSGDKEGGSAPSALAPEELFIVTVRDNPNVDVSTVSDDALLLAGEEVCAALDRGASPAEVLLAGLEESDAAPVILGTAAAILCRDHLDAVRAMGD